MIGSLVRMRQSPQDAGLEGHQADPRPRLVEVVAAQRGQQGLVEREPDRVEVGRVLELDHHADAAAAAHRLGVHHRQDLGEGGDALASVVGGVGRPGRGQPLARREAS